MTPEELIQALRLLTMSQIRKALEDAKENNLPVYNHFIELINSAMHQPK